MKKMYLFTLLFLITTLLVNAQYKLSSGANAFRAGDKHPFVLANPINEGLAGENIIWDFSGVTKNGKTLTTNMSNAAASEKASHFPQANLCIEEAGTFFYFKVTSDGMEQCGSANSCCVTRYDERIAKLKFPFAYSNKVSGEYSGVNITQNGENKISGTYEVIADAYGTLLLPGNVTIKKALRVKQTRTFANSNMKEVTYRWYAKGVRYPILVIINYETPTQKTSSLTALYAHLGEDNSPVETAPEENKPATVSDVEVYPNPFRGEFTVKYKLDEPCKVTIAITDGSGKKLETLLNQKQDKGNYTTPLSLGKKLNPGVYYLRITADGKYITKLLVQQ